MQSDVWIRKPSPTTCCQQETHFNFKNIYRLKVKVWRKVFHITGKQKKALVAIFISDKIEF